MCEVMKRNGWTTLKQQVLCMTPRRFGKVSNELHITSLRLVRGAFSHHRPAIHVQTTSVSMFLAAMAWVVPGCELAVFSTGRRASSKLLEQTAEMILNNLPKGKSTNT